MKIISIHSGRWALAAALALCACGVQDQDLPQTSADDDGDGGNASSTGELVDDETTGDDGPIIEEESTGGTDGPGCTFIDCDDTGEPPPPTCDVFAQDCPTGEKCMPWANDGGGSWNDTHCVPLTDAPAQPGDACEVEGSGTSGFDNCDVGAMCWGIDPETNTGTCIAMCTGDQAAPLCDDPDTSCSITNDGVLVLCLPNCDPLLQDCPESEACYPVNDHFSCAPDASDEMGAAGEPCEFINACDAGNICVGAAATPDCAGSLGCCSPVCDVTQPGADEECPGTGQMCQPWYEEGAAPPGAENIGVCALPA